MIDRRKACLGIAAALAASPVRAASWADGENALHILVHKARRRLMLVRAGVTLHTFPIALGNNPKGTKRQAGETIEREARKIGLGRPNEKISMPANSN